MPYKDIREVDHTIATAIEAEEQLQQTNLQMIASENRASDAVMEAQGSILTNRNALGYPGSRLYPGAENIDAVEEVAIQAAKDLWGAEHVNVQPHSGSLANLAVYLAVLEPGDKVLSLTPKNGGHITHGHELHVSGDLYTTEHYHLDPATEKLDYEAIAQKSDAFEPDLIISGYSAYPRQIDWNRFQEIAESVGAYHLADIAHIAGIIAADEFPSPVGIADFCTGSTYKTIRAGRGGFILCDDEYAQAIDTALFPGLQGGAAMPNIAGKAVGFAEALNDSFHEYIQQTVANAKALAQGLTNRGIHVMTGGTDTHIVWIDLRESHPNLTGTAAEEALEVAGIIATKASVPGDERYPSDASGIRFGTAALTSCGFEADQMDDVADYIVRALNEAGKRDELTVIADKVATLCEQT